MYFEYIFRSRSLKKNKEFISVNLTAGSALNTFSWHHLPKEAQGDEKKKKTHVQAQYK